LQLFIDTSTYGDPYSVDCLQNSTSSWLRCRSAKEFGKIGNS